MGMFDHIICDFPLPNLPSFVQSGHLYQSKDLDCTLATYTIREDGRLLKGGKELDYTGVLCFYTSNIVGSGAAIYTRNGEDAHSIEFEAIFVNGFLQKLKQTENSIQPAFKSKPFKLPKITDEDRQRIKEREEEDLTGRVLYVGGISKFFPGYSAKVIYSGKKQHCFEVKINLLPSGA